jgi:gas vesicle protein
MSNNESDLGSFLAGFVIGALVGAATAIILAPQSGQATREQIAGFSSDLRRSADTYTREYRDKAESIITDTRTRAQQITEQVQDQVRIVLDTGKDTAEDVADNLNNNVAEAGS